MTAPMVTVGQLAKEWNVSRSTIYSLANTGELPSIRIGADSIRFERAVVDAYVEARRSCAVLPEAEPVAAATPERSKADRDLARKIRLRRR